MVAACAGGFARTNISPHETPHLCFFYSGEGMLLVFHFDLQKQWKGGRLLIDMDTSVNNRLFSKADATISWKIF